MVRANVINKQAKGGQANPDVVAGSRDVQALERVARECVTAYLREEKTAFCKVWGVESDYAARDQHHRGDSDCWAWYIGVPLVGGETLVLEGDAVDYQVAQCPGKIHGLAD